MVLAALRAEPVAASGAEPVAPRGCQEVPVAPQIAQWFRSDRIAFAPTELRGDFDGDGQADVAKLWRCGAQNRVVIYLRRGVDWQAVEVGREAAGPFDFLWLYRKSERDFDFAKMKPFRYGRDTVSLFHSEKSAVVFRWDGAKFGRSKSAGDDE